MAMIKGTSKMQTYPGETGEMGNHRGIDSYGWTQYQGMRVLKVPHRNITQLEGIGFRYVGCGTSYAYVIKP